MSDMGSEQSEGFSDEPPKRQQNGQEMKIEPLSSVVSLEDSKKQNENTKVSYYVRDKF
jgi:hypothetical protein